MNLCLDDCYDKTFLCIEDLEADDFCSNLEITLVALRIPHALGVNRNGVVAELEVVGGLQRYVNDACRGSEEVSILASSVQGEGSTYLEGTKRSVYLRESPKMVEEPRIEIVR